MPKAHSDRFDDWMTGAEAAQLMSDRSGHAIGPDYVRWLGNHGKLTTRKLSERAKLYLRRDCERYVVSTVRGPKPRSTRKQAA